MTIFIIYKTKYIKYESSIPNDTKVITGIVSEYTITEDKLTLTIDTPEKIICNYYLKDNDKFFNLYGSKVQVEGEIYKPLNNTVPNTFNYKKYLYQNQIYNLFTASKITVIESSFNFRNIVVNRINNFNTKEYLLLFIMGEKSFLDKKNYEMYQKNGVAHLLAISGLHISIFVLILEKLLNRIKQYKRDICIVLFLYFYLYITNFSVSLLRCFIFFVLKKLLCLLDINISNIKMLFLTAVIILFINPFYLYSVSFVYSFIITFYLFILKFRSKNYIMGLLIVSVISFLASFPISVNLNYEINCLSILSNIFFVPYVSFILFPISLLTFCFPFVNNLFHFLIAIFENLNSFFLNYCSFFIVCPKLNFFIIVIYYINLFMFMKFYKKKYIIIIIIVLYLNRLSYKINENYSVYSMDVGQGDCAVLISPFQKEVIILDTGGNRNYSVFDNVALFLKSLGIYHIDLLVISHGDFDHIGEFNNVKENFKIESAMLNFNKYNELEREILDSNLKLVDTVNLKYFKSINYNFNKTNENDSSLVLLFKLYKYNFLFSGDIGTKPLEKILSNNNLKSDFYKVSHHGSKNNTSNNIIEKINPSHSFISAGRNNIHKHPSKETLEILNQCNADFYTTINSGSILIKIFEDEYSIETYNP